MNYANVDISIVIVTMNHLPKLRQLLASIYYNNENPSFSYEVVLIDNCSKDGTAEFVKDNYPSVSLNVNSKVKGFAFNNNLGVSLSKGTFIFICNPDMILLKDSLEKAFHYAKENTRSAIICPKLLNSDFTDQDSIRGFHSLNILFARLISKGNDKSTNKIIQKYLLKEFDKTKIQQVDWAIGAAMIIKKDVYEMLNGFDEKFFLYVEDEDICLRAWKLGYQVTYFPESVMVHDHQRSSSKKLNKLTWFHFKSFVYFFIKHNLLFTTIQRSTLVKEPSTELAYKYENIQGLLVNHRS